MPDKKNKIDEDIFNKIISAAYGDAGLIDRLKIYFLIKKNEEAKRIFNDYRITAANVKKIPLEECPDSIIESLKIKTTRAKNPLIFKPVYVFSITLIIVSTFVAILLFSNKEKERVYTKAEIELAEKQVKESLVIVNRIFKKTEKLIQEEVLPKRIGKPIHKSLTIINDVLTGG
jgi:hypothetical protein